MSSVLAIALLGALAMGQDDALAAKSRTAKEALLAGRYSEAAKLYRELAGALPGNPGPRLSLAVALERGGHPAEAVPELNRIVQTQPQLGPAWFLLGLAYQQLGQPEKAIAPLRKAVQLDGSNVEAQLELADAELVAGDPRKAVDGFQTLAARYPGLAKAWQGLGLAYVTLGERASKRLDSVAPQSAYWNALVARARAGEDHYAEALALYGEALTQSPDLPGLHAARAEIYRRSKHPDWAATEDAREAQTPKPDCTAHAAACAYLAGRWSAAVAEAGRNATPENLYWAALASARLADQSFQRVAALPPSAEIHELLAEADQRTGRRVEAVAEWRKALASNPHDARIRGRLAESLVRDREYQEAAGLLQPLVVAHPENGDWQYLLGEALFEQRRADAALPHLLAALRLQPDHLPAAEALGRVYLELGQPAKAVTYLERARPLDDGSISFALSTAYRRLGKTEQARASLARYRQLTRDDRPPSPAADNTIPPP